MSGSASIRLLGSQPDTYPLEYRFVPSEGVFIYRWALSSDNPNVPGGVPVPRLQPISIGHLFPSWNVALLDGTKIDLSATTGRIRVLSWWHTRCIACLNVMPALNALVEKYKEDVDFLAVTFDPIQDVREFLSTHAFEYDQTLTDSSAFSVFGSVAPRNIVLDSSGRVILDYVGGAHWAVNALEAAIKSHLRKR